MAIYGYVRVSTAMQADNGESLDAQRRQVEGYAMQQGWDLDHVYVERGVSGSAIDVRSVFAADLDNDGDVDVLSASISDNKIAWYENSGLQPPAFTEHIVTDSAPAAKLSRVQLNTPAATKKGGHVLGPAGNLVVRPYIITKPIPIPICPLCQIRIGFKIRPGISSDTARLYRSL